MEKLPIVYESLIGTLFLVKNVGSQTLLMAPGMELTRLDVEDKNWMNLDHFYPDHEGSYFHYLCMTGEKVCSEDLIVPLLNMGEMQEEEEILRNARHLKHWGVESDMEPVTLNFCVKTERNSPGQKSYEIFGNGVLMRGNPTPECTAEAIGYSLLHTAKTGFFSTIKVTITGFNEEDKAAAGEIFDKVCEIVQDEGKIKVFYRL
ncbi:MAG: hypothetical protein IKD75_02335 [Prevotella sp.]|nr:hypothetical protein [Prevotella sp.]